MSSTVQIVLPVTLADKVFGLYLFGAKEGLADLSALTDQIFVDEITARIKGLDGRDCALLEQAFAAAGVEA